MNRADALELLSNLAAGQWGMFTAAQAAALGLERYELARVVKASGATRVRHGVYLMAGVPTDHLTEVKAQWLAMDPGRTLTERLGDAEPIVASYETAALAWGFGDFSPQAMYFTSPRRVTTRQPGVRIHKASLPGRTTQHVDGLPVTSPRRTLEDLARSGRWEDGHLRDAIRQAHEDGLLPSRDINASKRLRVLVPELAAPDGDRSVRHKLRNVAATQGTAAASLYGNFHRLLFTARLMERDPGWVLKGGTGLYARLASTRETKDLDLFREGQTSAMQSAQALQDLMTGERIGRYHYTVMAPSAGGDEQGPTARLRVEVNEGAQRVFRFNIDVSAEIDLVTKPQEVIVTRGDDADIRGYPSRFLLRLYPLENQVAPVLPTATPTATSM